MINYNNNIITNIIILI